MTHETPAYRTLKQDMAALQKSKDLFHAIFEGSRDAIFITDDNKQFAYVNQAACVRKKFLIRFSPQRERVREWDCLWFTAL